MGGRSRPGRGKTHSVKALLSGSSQSLLGRLAAQENRQAWWRKWLENKLPEGLAARLSGVVEREDALIIFAESAAWSARVRYALAEIEPDIREERPAIRRVSVRVLPRGAPKPL